MVSGNKVVIVKLVLKYLFRTINALLLEYGPPDYPKDGEIWQKTTKEGKRRQKTSKDSKIRQKTAKYIKRRQNRSKDDKRRHKTTKDAVYRK